MSEYKENFRLIIPFFDKKQAKKVSDLLENFVIDGKRYFLISYIEDNRDE